MCAEGGNIHAPPPDGGWAWVVVFASFMIHVLADGVIFSFGVLHHELVKYFQATEASTSLIASILVGFTLCVGPVSSALVNRHGCRAVAVAGGLVGAFGFFISAFANNIITLQVTIGVIAGTGLGLIYLPATVAVMSHFERRRSLATGISVCGSGVGTFIMAPMRQWMVDEYGWRGAMIISAGLLLHILVFGLLLRRIVPKPESSLRHASLDSTKGTEDLDTTVNGEKISISDCQKENNENAALVNGNMEYVMGKEDRPQSPTQEQAKGASWLEEAGGEENPLVSDSLENGGKESKLFTLIGQTFHLSLFRNPTFILFALSNFSTSLGFNVPFLYIVSQAEVKGLAKIDGSRLLSIIGIANTTGRIVLGYFFDKRFVNRLWVYNMCLIVGGLSTALSTLCTGMLGFALYAATFGFTVGAYAGLTSVIAVDLLGLSKLSTVFGHLLLLQGIANLLGPPITGWLYDSTQSYSPGFIFAGTVISLSGLILFIVPSVEGLKKKEEHGADSVV